MTYAPELSIIESFDHMEYTQTSMDQCNIASESREGSGLCCLPVQ